MSTLASLAYMAAVTLERNGFDIEDYVKRHGLPERLIPRRYELYTFSPLKKSPSKYYVTHDVSYSYKTNKFKVVTIQGKANAVDLAEHYKSRKTVTTEWDTIEEVVAHLFKTIPNDPKKYGSSFAGRFPCYRLHTRGTYVVDTGNVFVPYLDEDQIKGLVCLVKYMFMEVVEPTTKCNCNSCSSSESN